MAKKEEVKEVVVEKKCEKVLPLGVTFQSEDMNKVVEKINEIINKCQ
jgi:hypothetical protein